MSLVPPYTEETAHAKVKIAQNLWNTRKPQEVSLAYTPDCIWRNRTSFFQGRAAIEEFLTAKWKREVDYRLRKELFSWHDNKIAVQFWYEFRDAEDGFKWKRCYGIEHWTFNAEGKMEKRMMSGNDLELKEGERWFTEDVVDVDKVEITSAHW
jgi:nuclear transport factor 2 (NTF2) superfamily protein